MRLIHLLPLAALLALAAPAAAATDPTCLAPPPAPAHATPAPLRFGITPLVAGSAGSQQGAVTPDTPAATVTQLAALQPPRRRLVVRLNRLFSSDGSAGIARFAALVRSYGRAGFDVESQVRYHPAAADDGNLAKWEAFVREAATALGHDPALVALTITNEVNLPISANTSDGAFKHAAGAILRGIPAARSALDRIGRPDVELGFSYAYRFVPTADASFWKQIGAGATPAFRSALDYVGVQLYPGLFWPPVLLPGQSAGDATLDALGIVRSCYLPMAGIGKRVRLWITENGYATNLGHDATRQAAELRSTIEAVHAHAGSLGVSDYRYFNLRDNRSAGTDLFDAVGCSPTTTRRSRRSRPIAT